MQNGRLIVGSSGYVGPSPSVSTHIPSEISVAPTAVAARAGAVKSRGLSPAANGLGGGRTVAPHPNAAAVYRVRKTTKHC